MRIRVLVAKEVKDTLRDPRIIIPFVISALILPVIGLAVSIPMKAAVQQAVEGARVVAVIDLDRTAYSREFVEWLRSKLSVVELPADYAGNVEKAAEAASAKGASVILVLDKGFGESLSARRRAEVRVISVVDEIYFLAGVESSSVQQLVDDFALSKILEGTGIAPGVVRRPVNFSEETYVKAKGVALPYPPAALAGISMSVMLVPMIVLSMAMVVMQMSATSAAVENEEKTLETLLTLPVTSTEILLSKLAGMFIVSLIGSALEVIGLVLYLQTFAWAMAGPSAAEGLLGSAGGLSQFIGTGDVALLAASLVLSLLFSAAIGVMVGALSKDVRIASTLMSPIAILVLIPGYIVAFAPSKLLGAYLKTLLYVVPVTQPVVMSRDIIGARVPPEAPLYLLASLALSLAVMYLAGKFFSLETLSSLQYRVERIASRLKRK